jgi:hypothetical protein
VGLGVHVNYRGILNLSLLLKTKDTDILKGYQIYHNYVRPHLSLDGKTPAEACGIIVEGKNKWKTIIQNASK